ncbi:MAG TPA: putative zinc-binding metallopeptidase [Polyangiaceae bacterium]|nr:putative zinc-binding metallopeptidase [Polyangiaceae bacterium]
MAGGRGATRMFWEDFSDDELLDLRFCELKLSLERGPLAPAVEKLHAELRDKSLVFRPHVWISSEWFSPDGVAGVAVPFFLAHPRLTALERRQMSYVEGGSPGECMRLLRHEAGHAIDTAYGFFRRAGYRELFGRTRSPYNSYYSPRPSSKAYVHNLARWYAQSHPSEDFAETFAVWLNPRSRWRQRYQGKPALDKLVYVDDLMLEVGSRAPRRVIRERVESLPQLTETLSEHYVLKRRHYSFGRSKFYDSALVKLFPPPRPYTRAERASVFMTRQRARIVDLALAKTRFDSYSVNQGLFEMVLRSRRLGLRKPALPVLALCQATARLVLAFLERLEQGRHRLVR